MCKGTEAGKSMTCVTVQGRPAWLVQREGEGCRTWLQGHRVVSDRRLMNLEMDIWGGRAERSR